MMRRIATTLAAVLLVAVLLPGCQKKKTPEYEVQNLGTDTYASAADTERTSGFNTYPVQSVPYEPATSYPSEPAAYPTEPTTYQTRSAAPPNDSYSAGAGGARDCAGERA